MKKPRKRYSAEFKAQAVELMAAGRPVSELAEELCVSANLLYNWRRSVQGTQLGSEGLRAVGEETEAEELRALQREVVLLRQENDILKKAAIILGTRPRPSFTK